MNYIDSHPLELSLAVYELNKKPSVPWEGPLKIAKTWKKLTYEQKVLNILNFLISLSQLVS